MYICLDLTDVPVFILTKDVFEELCHPQCLFPALAPSYFTRLQWLLWSQLEMGFMFL